MIIKGVKKITNRRFLNLFAIQYKDRKKNDKEWVFASRSGRKNPLERDFQVPDAVVIVPYHVPQKKLVLIEEFRLTLGGIQYGFPAGLVDKGETVEEAGKRELYEETGLTVTRILKKSPVVFSSSGLTDESICLLYVECEGVANCRNNEASEEIEVVFADRQKAAGFLGDPALRFDIKTWIVLNTFASDGVF